MTLLREELPLPRRAPQATKWRDLAGKPFVPEATSRDMAGVLFRDTMESWPGQGPSRQPKVSKRDFGGWWAIGLLSAIVIATALNTSIRNLNENTGHATRAGNAAGS